MNRWTQRITDTEAGKCGYFVCTEEVTDEP
jgi:hypothetical protein